MSAASRGQSPMTTLTNTQGCWKPYLENFYNLYTVYVPRTYPLYTAETIYTKNPNLPKQTQGGSLSSSQRAGSSQPITFFSNACQSLKNQVQHQLMVAFLEVLSSPVQTTVTRSKSHSTPCTSLTSSLSQPFASCSSSITMYDRYRATSSFAPVPLLSLLLRI